MQQTTKSKRRAARPKRERGGALAFSGRWPDAKRALKTPCECSLGTCERCMRAAQRAAAR